MLRLIEGSIQSIETQANEHAERNKGDLKSELYNDLRSELVTKEFVWAEINEVRTEIADVRSEIAELRAEMKQNALLLKILIGIAVFGLTLFNPAFVKLVELLMK